MLVCVIRFDADDVGSLEPEVNDFISRSVGAVANEVDPETVVIVDINPSNVGASFVGAVANANSVATSRGGYVAVVDRNEPIRVVFEKCNLAHLIQPPAP